MYEQDESHGKFQTQDFPVHNTEAGNALARVQRVHEPVDLWDITFRTRTF